MKNPKQEKIRVLFSNSLVLSILPAIFIALLLPLNKERYLLEEATIRRTQEGRVHFFEDLTGDGYSEEIYIGGEITRTGFIIQNRQGIPYNKWNLRGEANFAPRNKFWVADDFFGTGKKELVVFSMSNDSIFLSMLSDPMDEEQPTIYSFSDAGEMLSEEPLPECSRKEPIREKGFTTPFRQT